MQSLTCYRIFLYIFMSNAIHSFLPAHYMLPLLHHIGADVGICLRLSVCRSVGLSVGIGVGEGAGGGDGTPTALSSPRSK